MGRTNSRLKMSQSQIVAISSKFAVDRSMSDDEKMPAVSMT